MTKTACNICGNTEFLPFSQNANFYRCSRCQHVISGMYLKEGGAAELYGHGYFFGGENGEYADYIADQGAHRKNFSLRLKVLERFVEPARHTRLLEIGCAYGFFLEMAKKIFHDTVGIDVAREGVRYAKEVKGLDVVESDFLAYDLRGRKFDVVCMWDTIEHLMDPAGYLEKIGAHMDTGGLVAITTGDIGSLNASIRKDKWRLMHSPTHVHFFSKKGLTDLLDRKGFDVVYSRYCGFARSLDMIFYRILKDRKKVSWLRDVVRKSRHAEMFVYLNLYDIMYVIARKR